MGFSDLDNLTTRGERFPFYHRRIDPRRGIGGKEIIKDFRIRLIYTLVILSMRYILIRVNVEFQYIFDPIKNLFVFIPASHDIRGMKSTDIFDHSKAIPPVQRGRRYARRYIWHRTNSYARNYIKVFEISDKILGGEKQACLPVLFNKQQRKCFAQQFSRTMSSLAGTPETQTRKFLPQSPAIPSSVTRSP